MNSLKKILTILAITLTVASTLVSCKQQPKITPEEAKTIAEEAYIYAYPMIMGYRAHYLSSVDTTSPIYRAPLNQILNDATPADHTREDVVSINGDTPYSNFGLDLRAEPMAFSVPAINDRYYVFQFADLFTHNFAFVGTRATGIEAGDYLFVGPKWDGEIPKGQFKKIFHSESQLIVSVGRTQLLSSDDLSNVAEIQKGYKISTLSEFLGEEPKPTSELNWIPLNLEELSKPEFINYFNFYLSLVEPIHENDKETMARFAKIGIKPGGSFDRSEYSEEVIKAIEEGITEANEKIAYKAQNIAESINGWSMMDAFGPREFFKNDWLLRAAAAMVAIYANDKIEAFYPMAFVDGDGGILDGKSNKYKLQFTKDELPPAKYFWSVTMYDKRADGIAGYLVDNPIDRYLINSTTEELVYNEDGGLTMYIQNKKPEDKKVTNWLPAPADEFYLIMRIYGPKESVMNGTWAPPAVIKID